MKFKIDENVAVVAKEIFLRYGHHVQTVPEENLTGAKDSDLSEFCRRENKIIVTFDIDFGDVRGVPRAGFPGVLILRLRNQSPRSVSSALVHFLQQTDVEDVTGTITIIEEDRHRIHPVEKNQMGSADHSAGN